MRTRRSRARISIAVLVVFALVGVFIVRLVDIQVVRADDLNAESEGKRAQTVRTYGVRGDIVDANGALLADSVERYDITASPRIVLDEKNVDSLLTDLQRIAETVGGDANAMLAALQADPTADWAQLVRGITYDQFQAVEALDIPWTYIELRPERVYPNGQIAANLVGFMGTDGAQAGLEYTQDSCLASEDGVATFERAADGTRLPGSSIDISEAKNGGVLHTTIDRDLEWWVQQRMVQAGLELGATKTSAVVMRVSDAALVAVTDWPTLDSNDVDGASVNDLGSRAFSTPYEPGSVIKALTAASLVDAGVATPTSGVVAPYAMDFGEAGVISDAFVHDTLNLTLTGMLVESSNTATAQFSELLSQDARRDYFEKFGFGTKTAVEFSGEAAGVIPDYWDSRTNYTVQFGQGMTATAVQVAGAFQALGNGGVRMPAHLVTGCELPDGTMTDTPSTEGVRVVSEAAANTTLEMMEQVTLQSGSGPLLQVPGYRVGVKSGTAEVAENGAYTDKVVISYVGVAPIDDPQYVVLVTADIPSTIFSGRIAPVFQDVMSQTLTHFRVPPSSTPASSLPATW